MTIPIGLGLLGASIVVMASGETTWGWIGLAFGWLLLLFAGGILGGLLWMMSIPRLAYRDGQVLFFLRLGPPIVVPLEALEIFLVGRQGAHAGPVGRPAQVACVIVRMRDRAKAWRECQVSPALASWQDGYVTIRGTWCEPVSPDLLKRLNRRLRELQREGEAVAER